MAKAGVRDQGLGCPRQKGARDLRHSEQFPRARVLCFMSQVGSQAQQVEESESGDLIFSSSDAENIKL